MSWLDVLIFGGFGALALGTYGAAFVIRFRTWRDEHDILAYRRLLAAIALFLVAFAGVLTILLGFLEAPIELRRLAGGIAWGSFGAAGVFFLDAVRRS